MRIGIDARFLGPKGKGLGRYTQKLIENLEKIDEQNEYVIFLRRENWDEYEPKSPKFQKALADWRWYSLAEQIKMPANIFRQKIDLMHFPHFNVPILYFRPFVVTIHDLILRHFPTRRASTLGPLKYWAKNLAYKIVIWLAIKRAKMIIVPSHYVESDILKNFKISEEKIIVTYEGAPPVVRPAILKAGNILHKYGIKKPYLIYVGNAYPHKNLERLIEAFEILGKKSKRDLQLVLVGEEDYFYRRLKQSVKSEKIIFTGFVQDNELDLLYRDAELYIFPSLCEGFGLPPLEAMVHGVPVVSSDATCLPEILGKAVIYFDAARSQNMADKINRVLIDKDLAARLILAGYLQIKKYSWQKMAEETREIYGKLF